MKKIIITIAFVLVFYLVLMVCLYQEEYGIVFDSAFGNYLSGTFAPLSAIATIAVSYLIYKLTTIEKRADDDFKIIVEIYFKIEETFELLKRQNLNTDYLDDHNSYYERQIKVDCMLLLNYIRRFPNKKYSTYNLEKTLIGIYVNPNYESDYIELASEFQNFCFELNPKRYPSSFKLDNYEKN